MLLAKISCSLLAALSPSFQEAPAAADFQPLVYAGGSGAGAGKHVVLVAGDEEYRSEEALPMLARILAVHHGFRCTVLFSLDRESGEINPDEQTWIPGLEALADADMLVLFLRFRELPDRDMAHIARYLEAGKPVLGIRTSTHAFDIKRNKEGAYAHWHWRSGEWPGGFGQQVLGDTWINHHGQHGTEATRGVIEAENAGHPLLRGVRDVFGPTDVYGVRNLVPEATVLLRGQVVAGMSPDDPAVQGAENEPMMPLVWTKSYEWPSGKTTQAVCSTIGAATDCLSEDLRRLFINTCYWGCGLEVPQRARADTVGAYYPTPFGFGRWRKGVRPGDYAITPIGAPPEGQGH